MIPRIQFSASAQVDDSVSKGAGYLFSRKLKKSVNTHKNEFTNLPPEIDSFKFYNKENPRNRSDLFFFFDMFIDLVESIVDPFGKHKFSPYTSVDISFKNGKYQETVQLPHKESGKKLEQPIKAVINKALSKLQEINQQEERNAKRVVHIQAELPKVQEKVQRAQNELTGLKSGEPKLEKQKSLLEKQIKLLDAQEKAYQETISEHRENLDIYEFELIERAQLQNSTKEDLQLITEKIKAEKESIRLAQEGLDLIGKQKVTTQKDIAEMEGSINTLKNQIQSKNDEITLYKNSITRYQRELDKLTK